MERVGNEQRGPFLVEISGFCYASWIASDPILVLIVTVSMPLWMRERTHDQIAVNLVREEKNSKIVHQRWPGTKMKEMSVF